jgi:predicted GNAT family acetyltransferase
MFHGFVQPEYRKKGLYQIVNYDLAKKLVALGLPRAWVYVMSWNEASLNAYKKMGATRVDPDQYAVDWIVSMPAE